MSLTPDQIRQLFEFPIQAPPQDVIPDFVDSVSNGKVFYACAGVCYAAIVAAFGFRIAAKFTTAQRRVTWVDGMLLLSVLGVVSWIAVVVATLGGHAFGRHSWNVKLSFFTTNQLILSLLTTSLYPLWILTIKLSVLLMYLELFGRRRWLRYWSYVGIATFTAIHVALVLIWSIICRPRGGHDQVAYLAGFLSPSCSSSRAFVILQPVVNLVGDFFLILLPLPAIWGLNMDRKKKFRVSAMFLTGFCAVAAGLVALVYRLRLMDAEPDNTWKATYTWAASAVEMTAGILVVCIPSIPTVAKRCMPAIKSKMTFRLGSSSSQSPFITTDTKAVSGRAHWLRRFSSTTERSTRPSVVAETSEKAQLSSEDSNRAWKIYTGGFGRHHTHTTSDQVQNLSHETGISTGEIQKVTEFHVATVQR